MSTDLSKAEVAEVEHELGRLRDEWWYFLLLGVLLVIAGIACLAYPWFTTLGVVVFMGAVLIVSGVATIVSAFWTGKWSAFMVQILVGLLYVVTGFVIMDWPLESTALLTLMLASLFVIGGTFRIVFALVERYPQWGWSLLNGIVTLLLGMIIFRSFKQLPEEPGQIFWIVGLLVGLELLLNGWTWIMLALALRQLPEPQES